MAKQNFNPTPDPFETDRELLIGQSSSNKTIILGGQGGGGGANWGFIGGNIMNQADLVAWLNGKANTNHTHPMSAISGLSAALNQKANTSAISQVGFTGQYSDLEGIPSTFTPSAHTHTMQQVDGLENALQGKEPVFSKGAFVPGDNVTLGGNLSGRLVGAGDITIGLSVGVFNRFEDGLVPVAPMPATGVTKYLREDGTWQEPFAVAYSAMSAAEIDAGTSQASRLVSSRVLNDWLNSKVSFGVGSGLHKDTEGNMVLGANIDFSQGLLTQDLVLARARPTFGTSGVSVMQDEIVIQTSDSAPFVDSYFRISSEEGLSLLKRNGAGNDYGLSVTNLGAVSLHRDVANVPVQRILLDPTQGMIVSDALNEKGFEYAEDYSANFTANSLVTAKWVEDNAGGDLQSTLEKGSTSMGTLFYVQGVNQVGEISIDEFGANLKGNLGSVTIQGDQGNVTINGGSNSGVSGVNISGGNGSVNIGGSAGGVSIHGQGGSLSLNGNIFPSSQGALGEVLTADGNGGITWQGGFASLTEDQTFTGDNIFNNAIRTPRLLFTADNPLFLGEDDGDSGTRSGKLRLTNTLVGLKDYIFQYARGDGSLWEDRMRFGHVQTTISQGDSRLSLIQNTARVTNADLEVESDGKGLLLKSDNSAYRSKLISSTDLTKPQTFILPKIALDTLNLVTSVNGNFADDTGNIEIGGGSIELGSGLYQGTDGKVNLGLDFSTIGTTNKGLLTQDTYLMAGDLSIGKYSSVFISGDSLSLSQQEELQYNGVTLNSSSLQFDYRDAGGNSKQITISSEVGMVVSDWALKGFEYAEDYSANFTDHSLVSKKWVMDYVASLL